MSFFNATVMADKNPSRIRLDRVSQTTLVRRERAAVRTTRSQVDDNPFDGLQRQGFQPSGSHSRSHLSQAYTSQGHESLNDVADPEVPEVQEETTFDAPLRVTEKGPLRPPYFIYMQTMLLDMYRKERCIYFLFQ